MSRVYVPWRSPVKATAAAGVTVNLDALTLAIHHLVGEARITDIPWYFP